jgi:glycerol uptake facilitator-like aquaporin
MNKLKSFFVKILDSYLDLAIGFDIVISVIIWISIKNVPVFCFLLLDKQNQVNLFSCLIGADISLAGFILAALTIIVTFKSSVAAKGLQEATNALQLVLSSSKYNSLVKVFKKSLIELILCSLFVFCIWIAVDSLSIQTLNRVNIIGILLTFMALGRSLLVLFTVLTLDKNKDENDKHT